MHLSTLEQASLLLISLLKKHNLILKIDFVQDLLKIKNFIVQVINFVVLDVS